MSIVLLDMIYSYHAHIYFADAAERDTALGLRAAIGDRFSVQLGRVHDRLIGPHARPMYQVAFARTLFADFVPWLMLNRQGLAILVHPNTGQPRRDHLVHALWLGAMLPIMNSQDLPEFGDPEADIPSNTQPSLPIRAAG